MKYESKPLLPAEFGTRYAELCALRDSVNATNAPLEAELEQVNAAAEAARVRAAEIAAQIDANRGGQAWIDLKRDIGALARSLSGRKG